MYYQPKFQTVHIPDTVKIIGTNAFASNYGLTAVRLPGGLKEIRQGAFRDCQRLETVDLPASLRILGSRAFVENWLKQRAEYYGDESVLPALRIEAAGTEITAGETVAWTVYPQNLAPGTAVEYTVRLGVGLDSFSDDWVNWSIVPGGTPPYEIHARIIYPDDYPEESPWQERVFQSSGEPVTYREQILLVPAYAYPPCLARLAVWVRDAAGDVDDAFSGDVTYSDPVYENGGIYPVNGSVTAGECVIGKEFLCTVELCGGVPPYHDGSVKIGNHVFTAPNDPESTILRIPVILQADDDQPYICSSTLP